MSLLATRTLEARLQNPSLSNWTERTTRAGALNAFIQGNSAPMGVVSPNLFEQARNIVGRDLKIPVFAKDSVTVQTTRPVTIADDENDGQLYTVSYAIAGFGFTMRDALHLSNDHGVQADFNRKFYKGLNAVIQALETAALSHLDTNKNQVSVEELDATFATNIYTFSLANQDIAIGEMGTIMSAHDFFSTPYQVIGNAGLQNRVMQMAEHDIYNDQNKTIQWMDKQFHWSNSLSNALNRKATGYIVDNGALGFLTRREAESILETQLPDGTTWGTEVLPIINMPFDTYMYYSRGDSSSIAGAASAHLTRSAIVHYGYTLEYAFVSAYNSDLATYSNPIMKFDIATS